MPEKLGILVTGAENADHVLGLARAARAAGKDVIIFLSGDGVLLTQDSRISELIDICKVGVCEVSYNALGFKGKEVPGLSDKDFVTQGFNAEMVEECDRYITL